MSTHEGRSILPHLSARMACGTGREERRQRVEAGDPGTPGLRSDS